MSRLAPRGDRTRRDLRLERLERLPTVEDRTPQRRVPAGVSIRLALREFTAFDEVWPAISLVPVSLKLSVADWSVSWLRDGWLTMPGTGTMGPIFVVLGLEGTGRREN